MTEATFLLALAVVAGLLSLDETAAFQLMLSQPLVAAFVAGFIVRDVQMGLVIGAALQLVWIGVLPVGAAPFPDAALAGVVGVGVAWVLSPGVVGGWGIAAGVLAAMAAGALGQRAIALVRRRNIVHADKARAAADRASAGGVYRAVALGLATRFAAGTVLAAVFLGAALLLRAWVWPPPAAGAFQTGLWAAPLAAAGVAAAARSKVEWVLAGAGFTLGAVVTSVG